MPAHDLSVGGDVLDRVTRCAQRALGEYGCHPGATVRLINVSENATYLIEDPDAGPSVLRVHRLGYHTPAEIASELAWMDALRAEAGVRTPRVLPAPGGERIVTVADQASGEERTCVRFEFLAGTEPSDDSLPHFAELGEITARMHRHARAWQRPAGFTRFHWDYDAAFGAGARWGRWQDGIGFSWYLYDAGTAVSFFEHEPHVPDLIGAWLSGYRRVLDLPAEDEAEIWTFILYRRLLLVAWIGSHTAVDIAQQLGAGYTAGSCDLAEAYLSRAG